MTTDPRLNPVTGRGRPRVDVPTIGELAGAWWLVLLAGVGGLVAGIVILALPGISLLTLAVVSGVFLLVDGAFELVGAFSRSTTHRGLTALVGALSAIAGILLIRHPVLGVTAIALLVGIWLVTFGIVRLVDLGDVREHRVWWIVVAILEIAAGIAIVAVPGIGVATLALLVGISFLVRGGVLAATGWAVRNVGRGARGV